MGVGPVGSGGVSPQLMRRLGEEDRQAIRQAQAERIAAGTTAPRAEAETRRALAPPSSRDARTPREAVQAIRQAPLPQRDDLIGLSWSVQQAMYLPRVQSYNDRRAEEAREALDRLAPQRADFKGLNPATANAEYSDALARFNADPYVGELKRVEIEATDQRSTLPAYLSQPEPTVNTSGISVPEMRDALSVVGVQLPANATPEQIDAGFELLASMPQSLASVLINPGMQVNFTGSVAGVGTSPFIPVGASASVQVEGEVKLSDEQVGLNFESTQQLEMSVELRGSVQGGTQRTIQQQIYTWAKRADWLAGGSLGVQDLVNSSPLLRNAVRGLPISFTYEQYAGTRLSYEAVLTAEQGARVDAGDLSAAPNPLNPDAMPAGTAVLIRGQALQGSRFEAGYKLLRVGEDHTELQGMGFGVRRGEGSLVEVISGPVSTVENELFVGLGYGSLRVGLMVDRSSELQRLQVAQIDLATVEGQAAYQAFISSGQVPAFNPPGVMRAGAQTVYNASHDAAIGAQVGGVSIALQGPSSDHTVTSTTWNDGTTEQVDLYILNGITSEVQFPRDARGEAVIEEANWRLLVPDTHPSLAGYLHDAFNPGAQGPGFDGRQHVLYTFTSAELLALRDQAREHVRQAYGEEYLQQLRAGTITANWANRDAAVAQAQTAEQVFMALEERPHELPEDLLYMSLTLGKAPAGRIEIRDAGE